MIEGRYARTKIGHLGQTVVRTRVLVAAAKGVTAIAKSKLGTTSPF